MTRSSLCLRNCTVVILLLAMPRQCIYVYNHLGMSALVHGPWSHCTANTCVWTFVFELHFTEEHHGFSAFITVTLRLLSFYVYAIIDLFSRRGVSEFFSLFYIFEVFVRGSQTWWVVIAMLTIVRRLFQ